ncbi:MAG: CxxC-x17-CxxC domain-containing protein [Patescibacteria group bacterium]
MYSSRKSSGGDWKSRGNDRGGSRGGFGGSRPSFGGGRSSGGYRGGDRDARPDMHSAVCDQCGQDCEVPFRPNGKKPVLCSDCFRKEKGDDSAPRFAEKRFDDRPRFSDKPAYVSTPRGGNDEVTKNLKAMNAKIDQILDILADLVGEVEDEELVGDEEIVEDEEVADVEEKEEAEEETEGKE